MEWTSEAAFMPILRCVAHTHTHTYTHSLSVSLFPPPSLTHAHKQYFADLGGSNHSDSAASPLVCSTLSQPNLPPASTQCPGAESRPGEIRPEIKESSAGTPPKPSKPPKPPRGGSELPSAGASKPPESPHQPPLVPWGGVGGNKMGRLGGHFSCVCSCGGRGVRERQGGVGEKD